MFNLETLLRIVAGVLVLVLWAGVISLFVTISHRYPYVPLIIYLVAVVIGSLAIMKGITNK